MPAKRSAIADFSSNLVARGALLLALAIPYRWRIPLFGKLVSHIVAPIAKYDQRIRENLNYVLPDLPEKEVRALCRSVPDNAGRSLIESYSGKAFKARAEYVEIDGPGLQAMEAARNEGRPIILVTGHFGNYDVPRAALIARGFNVGALYKPMKNPFFNRHYERSMADIGTPIFPRGRKGLSDMVRFLRNGGVLGFFIDNYVGDGMMVDFFGKPAPTTLSAAEMALRYDALILTIFCVRQENGLDFKVITNAPIEHTTAEEMTRQLSRELEQIVRKHMDQWFWIHRRWKPERQRKRAAATMAP